MTAKTCEFPGCGRICNIETSNSQKNPGKLYWACPNKCVKFNGWVIEESKKSTTVTNITNSSLRPCKTCGKTCAVKVSRSAKNIGKKYYACSSCPNPWNDWVEEPIVLSSQTLATPPPPPSSPVITEMVVPMKACASCGTQCAVQIMRFVDKPTEIFFKCLNCNLFNGALPAVVPSRHPVTTTVVAQRPKRISRKKQQLKSEDEEDL